MELTVTTVFNALLESLFVGFGILIPIFAFIRTSNLKTIALKELFILQAVQAVRIGGIMYAILQIPVVYAMIKPAESAGQSMVSVNYPTAFIVTTFFPALMYLIISQLFWIRKTYTKKAPLIILALLLLVVPSHSVTALVSRLFADSKDYLPSAWNMFSNMLPGDFAIRTLLHIVISFFIVFALMLLSGKLKKIVEEK